jgi:hypothetical protein
MRVAAILILSVATCASGHAADSDSLESLQQRVDANLRTSNVASLDAEADKLRISKARFEDGRWRLSMFFGAIGDSLPKMIADRTARKSLELKLDAYVRTHPKSMNAALIMAMLLEAEAWEARGHGYADTVSPKAWREFKEKMGQARAVLDGSKQTLSGNPAWFTERIDLATYTGEGENIGTALLVESIEREPRYLPNYFAGLVQKSPRWGGTRTAMVSFINRMGLNSPTARSEGLYARLVWFAENDYPSIEADPAIAWAEMTRSFDAILRTYPAERNAQKFFFMACMHSDKPEAVKLLNFVHAAPIPDLLVSNGPLFGMCTDWANGSLAQFITRDHDPDTGEVVEHLIK